MIKLYSLTVRTITFLIAAMAVNQSVAMSMQQRVALDTAKSRYTKMTDARPFRPSFASASTKIEYISFKPGYSNTYSGILTPKTLQGDPVNLLNVKIYPIPVADQINMSYHLSKDSNVLIEIMDLLGVKIATLLSQRKPAGEQKESFPVTSKLNTGVYIIRVTAGGQQVVKRIQVL